MNKISRFTIIPPTLLLATSALLSRFLGVVRDHMLAKTFGATAGTGIYNLDTYYAAFRIPDLLYNLLIFGAISAAFIPIFTQYKKEDKMNEAWAFASSMLHLMTIGILVISCIVYIFAPYLVHIVAGGFTDEAFTITVRLMRIMLLSPILFTLSSILISIQDSFRCFFFRSIGPLFYNLGIIAGIMYFGQKFGVVGVTWGVIIGAALQLIVQLPALLQVGYKHVCVLGFYRPDVRKAFKLLVPRVLALSMNQLTLLVNTFIASFLMTGSITIYYLADNLQALPLGIIAISFAITSFATLSELAIEPDKSLFAKEISRVMHQVLYLVIPATLGMLLLRKEIIDVILVSGKFSASDALITQNVLSIMLFSLFAQSLIPILSRGFYAHHDTKTPLKAGVIATIFSIGGSLVLAFYYKLGIMGITAAYSAGGILFFVLLYVLMRKKIQYDLLNWINIMKMISASIGMIFVVNLLRIYMPYGMDITQRITVVAVLILAGMIVYFALSSLFNIPERRMILRAGKKAE